MSVLKGCAGEKSAQFEMWVGLDDDVYRRFHDIILETDDGTMQIDHVVVSMYGIFVIEMKTYSGWIFGDERQPKWTQVLFGKKNNFQNPLHQNYRHTRELARALGIPHEKVHSVVFFIGESQFKTKMPPNVLDRGLLSYIQSFRDILFVGQQLRTLEEKIGRLKKNPASTRKGDVKNLTDRFQSTDTCPKCGAPLSKEQRATERTQAKPSWDVPAFPDANI
ncbi:MAG: Nuclease-related domain protein [Syntrophorhabdus sp. PtaU1.Bin153]|nr:MAG: Nuclease-related domain protein [Syntrophorhabdus sp. PtaU1.Bin153]